MTLRSAAWLTVVLLAGCGGEPERVDVPDLAVEADSEAREAHDAVRRAERLLAAGAPEDAEPLLRRALEIRPGDAAASRLLAQVLVDQRRYADAVPLLRELLAASPEDNALHSELTEALHVLGDLPAAEAAYTAWLDVDGKNDEALFGLGQVLYQLGRFDAAVRAFRRAEKRRASRADVRTELGLALQALGQLEEAEVKQRDALERDPRNAEAWFRLGDVISRRSEARRGEAIDAMRQAVRIDPRLAHAQLYLYRLLRQEIQAGDGEVAAEADRRWRSVLRAQTPRQLGPRDGAPRVRDTSGKAERRLRDRLGESPGDVAARRALAELLHADGAVDEALAEYSTLIDAGAGDAALLAAAGAAALASGRWQLAVTWLERSAADAAAPPDVPRRLAWALLGADRPEDALARYDELLAAPPDDVLLRTGRGLALLRLDRLDEGLQDVAAGGWLR